MSILEDWAIRLATEVAPDEVDLAATFVDAFVQGGAAREDLFRPARAAGGFDASMLSALLPHVFGAISVSGTVLLGSLRSPLTADFLACVKNGLSLVETAKKGQEAAKKGQPLSARSVIPGTDVYAPLRQLLDSMPRRLEAAGVSAEQAELTTFRVLKMMFDEPDGASSFVQNLVSAK